MKSNIYVAEIKQTESEAMVRTLQFQKGVFPFSHLGRVGFGFLTTGTTGWQTTVTKDLSYLTL